MYDRLEMLRQCKFQLHSCDAENDLFARMEIGKHAAVLEYQALQSIDDQVVRLYDWNPETRYTRHKQRVILKRLELSTNSPNACGASGATKRTRTMATALCSRERGSWVGVLLAALRKHAQAERLR